VAAAAVAAFHPKARLDHRDPMDNTGKTESQEKRVPTDRTDKNDHQWHHSKIGASLAESRLKANLEKLDLKDQTVLPVHLEKMPTVDIVDRPGQWDLLARRDKMESKASPEQKDPTDRLSINKEVPDPLDQLVLKDPLAQTAKTDNQASPAKMGKWDHKAMPEKMARTASPVIRVAREKPVLMGQPVLAIIVHHLARRLVIDEKMVIRCLLIVLSQVRIRKSII